MKTKKIILLLCSIAQATIYTETDSFSVDHFDQTIGFDDDFNDGETNYNQEINKMMHQTRGPSDCTFDTETLVAIATGILNLPALLQFNAYKHTNPVVIRSLHDLPSLNPWYGSADKFTAYATLFYNPMTHAYFTHCGKHITDYLAVAPEDALIGELENLISFVPQVLPLFNTATLQQRRLGFMLGASKCFGNLRFNIAAPLYYLELNFYLTQKQLDDLNAAPFFGGDAPIPDSDIAQNEGFSIFDTTVFAEHHAIADKFGLGDLRIYADYILFEGTRCPTRIGGQVTLPNNTVIRHSIVGSSFNPCYPGPALNIDQFATLQCIAEGDPADPLTLTAKNDLATLSQTFALQFIDRVSATVLENSLGQKHVSYGFLTEFFIQLTERTNFNLFFEWDQFVAGPEDRPARLVISPGESLDRDYADPQLAQDNLTFLQQRFNNILFPPIGHFTIKPGDIFKARAYSQTNYRTGQWRIGYDLWYQCKERIDLCCNCAIPNSQLDIQSAAKPAALQGKIFAQASVQKNPEEYQHFGWKVGLKGEATVNNYGIGKDWLIGFDFVADF